VQEVGECNGRKGFCVFESVRDVVVGDVEVDRDYFRRRRRVGFFRGRHGGFRCARQRKKKKVKGGILYDTL